MAKGEIASFSPGCAIGMGGNLNRGPGRGQGTWWPPQSGNSADRPVCRDLYWAAAGVCESAAGANCAANFAKN
jgi:hypothetical protein